jgi:predicted  nucleic acid-binding Zn-ribbon protein
MCQLTFALQALLVRHEAYMHDAERDRLEMSAKIEKLETDKRELEAENAKTIEENRGLLDQLEGLNSTVAESESHIKSLEVTLKSTHQEMRRLEALALRTHDLEVQLAALEQEQEVLQKAIVRTEAEERTAIQRWKKAERGLYDLQEQLERIEREAREERERHVEVLGRMERQRAVERELDTAAGRLKGAAAATTGNGKTGSNVVSHFVKDILQDNANLQLGIVELREMLMNSNDEVQALREQLMLHQPMAEENGDVSGPSTLRAELAPKEEPEPQVISQALHIHHHYHAPKKEEIRRPKKKRTSINTALFTPPRNIAPGTPRSQETANAILSQTAVTIPAPTTPNHRWSIQSGQMSDFAPSSVPSSPQSMYRSSNLFDRGFDIDSSRPTSPGSSIDPMSPQFQPSRHWKRGSEVSTRSFAAATNFQPHNVIHEEEDGDVEELPDLQTPSMPSLDDGPSPSDASHESEFLSNDHEDWTASFQPTLRRSTSHESILSISGIDIHTLKSRPSQLTITGGRVQSRLGTPTTTVSIDTLTSSSMITARPTLSRNGHDSTTYLRSSMGTNSDAHSINSSNSYEGLGRKVGGWVFGRWGVSPAKSSDDLKAASTAQASQKRVVSTPVADPLKVLMGRPPGINQKGPIPGFLKKVEKAPSKVKPDIVDYDALREILMEGGLPS